MLYAIKHFYKYKIYVQIIVRTVARAQKLVSQDILRKRFSLTANIFKRLDLIKNDSSESCTCFVPRPVSKIKK